MAITKTVLDAELEAAKTDIGSGAYASAKTNLAKAKITLAGLPDYAIGGRRLQYRDEIKALFEMIDDLARNTTTNLKYRKTFAKCTRE